MLSHARDPVSTTATPSSSTCAASTCSVATGKSPRSITKGKIARMRRGQPSHKASLDKRGNAMPTASKPSQIASRGRLAASVSRPTERMLSTREA